MDIFSWVSSVTEKKNILSDHLLVQYFTMDFNLAPKANIIFCLD